MDSINRFISIETNEHDKDGACNIFEPEVPCRSKLHEITSKIERRRSMRFMEEHNMTKGTEDMDQGSKGALFIAVESKFHQRCLIIRKRT